jgi:gliding motility-associated-like protein
MGYTQNLIFNPGFDSIIRCPDPFDGYAVSLAPPWESAGVSPDLFNICGNLGFQVPYNGINYQPARSGGGYVGSGYSGRLPSMSPFTVTAREYITAPLKKTLSKGVQYYLQLHVNVRSTNRDSSSGCFTDAAGMAFSSEKVFLNHPDEKVLYLDPALENRGSVLTDTMGWTPISGCYMARGDEKFVVLGIFRSDSETLAQPMYPNPNQTSCGGYLFWEDVGVWEFNPLPDTVFLCKGDRKTFHASFLDARFIWSDGTTDSTFTIDSPGVYSVSADMGNCILSDTTVVLFLDGDDMLPSDVLICQDEKVTLSAPISGDYEWSTGATTTDIEIQEAGVYGLTITNDCGIFTYESRVETEICDCPIYVPNIFSPNGDGYNDELLLFSACDFPLLIKHFQVFDRWGNLVYTSASSDIESIQWDGATLGKPLSSGVYTWAMEYVITRNGLPEYKILNGDVTILR